MKYFFIALVFFVSTASTTPASEEVELVCTRKHSASNTCHYNFKINGMNYRFTDVGCKNKKEELVKKAQQGKLGLARDWKVECYADKKSQ
jgi:hypothetical protein